MMDPTIATKLIAPLTAVSAFVQRLQTDEIWRWRAIFFTFLSCILITRQTIDQQLVHVWQYLMTSSALVPRIFRFESFEWILAVVCFFIYMRSFRMVDQAVSRASQQGRIHPWRKYRLQDRFEADRMRRRMLVNNANADSATASSNDTSTDKQWNLQVKHSDWHVNASSHELFVYILPLMAWDIFVPRRHRRLAPFGPPTTLGIMGGIMSGLLMYDFLFFSGHVLMHKVPFLYRTIHAKHHTTVESRACEVVRLTVIEEVFEFSFSIIALNLLSVHPLARGMYNCIIIFLLVELHCGFDFPWTPQNVVPFGLATGSRRHHYHHRNGKHYYQKFFFTFDRLFGFFQEDNGSIHGDSVKADAFVPSAWLDVGIKTE